MKSPAAFAAMVRASEARGRLRKRMLARALGSRPQPMIGWTPNDPDTMFVLGRDPSRAGGWRITRITISTQTPWGHSEHPDYAAAVRWLFVQERVTGVFSPAGRPLFVG